MILVADSGLKIGLGVSPPDRRVSGRPVSAPRPHSVPMLSFPQHSASPHRLTPSTSACAASTALWPASPSEACSTSLPGRPICLPLPVVGTAPRTPSCGRYRSQNTPQSTGKARGDPRERKPLVTVLPLPEDNRAIVRFVKAVGWHCGLRLQLCSLCT